MRVCHSIKRTIIAASIARQMVSVGDGKEMCAALVGGGLGMVRRKDEETLDIVLMATKPQRGA